MRSDGSDRTARRRFSRVIAGDWRRAAIAAATLATVLALGTFTGGRLFSPAHKPSNPGTAQKDGKGWGHRVGSIMFVPEDGSMCEQRRFDNATGRMLSLSYVKCSNGVARGDSSEPTWARDNTSRINAILSAFKK